MLICVDFDGTVVSEEHPYDDLETPLRLLPGAHEGLLALRRAGHSLVLWSGRASVMRRPRGNERDAVNRARYHQMLAFVEQKLPGVFDRIDDGTGGKPSADLFIDNRAVRLGPGPGGLSWMQVAAFFGDAASGDRPTYAEVARRAASLPVSVVAIGRAGPGPILRLDPPAPPNAPRLVVIAGQHGEEPAGVLALHHRGAEILAFAKAAGVALTIYPCVNPEGYERDQRYNWKGERPTNTAVQYEVEPGRWVGELLPGERALSTRPAIEVSRESAALAADLAARECPMGVLDLHQDSALRAGESFAYVFGNRLPYRRITRSVRSAKAGPRVNWSFTTASWSERPANLATDAYGLVEFADGSIPAALWLRGAKLVATLETSLHDMPCSVETSFAWILGMIHEVAELARATAPALASSKEDVDGASEQGTPG